MSGNSEINDLPPRVARRLAKEGIFSIPSDMLYPRDEEHRLRIYGRRGDDTPTVIAATDAEGLGPTLLQLDADERERGRRLVDLGAIGVLDAVERRWLIMPWHKPER